MQEAALKAIRELAANYESSRCTVSKTERGWEARRGGKLVGIAKTRAGALELLDALPAAKGNVVAHDSHGILSL